MSQPQAVPAAAPLDYTPAVALSTAAVGARLRTVIPAIEWPLHAPYVAAIAEWKRRRNAVILAHNYQTPEIYHGVADFTGDSLALARHGARTEAEVIVLAGVHFMAETAKILSPEKTVLIPDPRAGCSLAASITARDIRLLRQRYPGVPVVTYVNTSAAVKAESDVCCTSANAVAVVESLGVPRVIFLPDEYLGRYVAEQTAVEIILWRGHCEVHERFTAEDLRGFRTECSMSDNVAVEFPDVEFIRPCALCPHMKRITLPKILRALETLEHRVEVAPEIAARARLALDRMLAVGRRESGR